MPTLGCEMHRLVPRRRTAPRRKTGSSVYVVFKGSGETVVNDTRFALERGDVFVTPSWSTVEHEAREPADLLAVADRPVLEALHLYREETPTGCQDVKATFQPC